MHFTTKSIILVHIIFSIWMDMDCLYLRNKMLIFNVHRCMNYIWAVQSWWSLKDFTDTLNGFNVVHTPMDVQKYVLKYLYLHYFYFLYA